MHSQNMTVMGWTGFGSYGRTARYCLKKAIGLEKNGWRVLCLTMVPAGDNILL